MLVCLCNQISDSQIRAAVRSGACDRRAVARACRAAGQGAAGQGCGSCLRAIDSLIVEELRARPEDLDGAETGGVLAPPALLAAG